METVPLTYTTTECSGHSGKYAAHHIRVDNPMDQGSRWSGAYQGSAAQWVMLELDSLAVVKTITFGKFHKTHPCNMKEFKIFVGPTKEHMVEVLHDTLKNDPVPETFLVKHTNSAGIEFPTRYIKIVPISPHGPIYHISIWHVALSGINNSVYVKGVETKYNEYRETIMLRHILKHLRQRRLLSSYGALLSQTDFKPEHPLITTLYQHLVTDGAWSDAEKLLDEVANACLFDNYMNLSQPHAVWKRLLGTDEDGDVPSPRGGHAMCIDQIGRKIYLLGGWDGNKSLDDFWVYDIEADTWQQISSSTSVEANAPSARYCHKMVFDPKSGNIYVLGRLSDGELRPAGDHVAPQVPTPVDRHTSSEFYRYHTRGESAGTWHTLNAGPGSLAPPTVFDHQMVMDSNAQILYVFGGRIVDDDWGSPKYSGLYSYNVRVRKWTLLQATHINNPAIVQIPPRLGHSMVLEPITNKLFIFAGQYGEGNFLSDMYEYDIATQTVTEVSSNFTSTGGPTACFTQRAVIDPQLREIYVLCGLNKDSSPGSSATLLAEQPPWVFRYDPPPGHWVKVLPEPTHNVDGSKREVEQPVPRYASQVVYDQAARTVYVHGGNAGPVATDDSKVLEEKRMDDFWCMKLVRPDRAEIIRRARSQIRQQQFREMCQDGPAIVALGFLQTNVSQVVNHNDPGEAERFRSLLTHLLSPSTQALSPDLRNLADRDVSSSPPRKRSRPNTPEDTDSLSLDGISLEAKSESMVSTSSDVLSNERFKQRNALFESILQFVAVEAKHPPGSMLDLVNLEMDSL